MLVTNELLKLQILSHNYCHRTEGPNRCSKPGSTTLLYFNSAINSINSIFHKN